MPEAPSTTLTQSLLSIISCRQCLARCLFLPRLLCLFSAAAGFIRTYQNRSDLYRHIIQFYYVPCFFLSASYFPSKSSIACYRSLGSAGPVFICMCLCRRTIMTNVQVKSIITLQRPSVPFRIVICRAMLPLLMRVFIFVHASSHPVFSAALLLLPLRFRLQFLLLYLFLGGVTFFVYLYFFFCVLFCFYNVILLIFKGADSKGTTLTLAQVLTKVLQYIQ